MPVTIGLPSGLRVSVAGEPLVVGRALNCDVCLADEAAVQPEHAKISRIAGRWLVESLGDWFVQVGNQAPGRKNWLKPGEAIRLSPEGPEIVFEPGQASHGPWQVVSGGVSAPAVRLRAVPAVQVAEPPSLPRDAAGRATSQPAAVDGMPPLPTAAAQPTIPPDLPPDAPPDLPPDAPSNLQLNVPPKVARDVVPDVPPLPQTSAEEEPPPLPPGGNGA